jgi:phosphoglycerol transferase MdoB-like AlkP superfamily enzyme
MNHRSRLLLASFALAAAGVESLLVSPGRRAKEPTRSLFAALLVLAISQIVDASRFIVLAIALLHAPLSAALGARWAAARRLPSAGSAPVPCWRPAPR